jgi:2-hydroxy-3-keto-5-methylthiopentenyl-1-phosphate phosphatase
MKNRYFIDVIKKIYYSSNVKIPLGRWNIHNYKQTSLKIKYANEDNCGICRDYTIKEDKENKENKENYELYIYMMGLESVPEIIDIKKINL